MARIPGSKRESPSPAQKSGRSTNHKRTPLWLALFLPVAAILIFFLLLEGGLTLVGFRSDHASEDPFVGFASNVPLFVPAPGPQGKEWMVTSSNKTHVFTKQSFPREKTPGTYRIFTLGGSTTYGHPYSNDVTSFATWLRELLPLTDRTKKWEVINAGGISYASYRAAHLMEELVQYRPDLFIVYTGHNEFLEERTYAKIKEIPPAIRSAVSFLAGTRTWSAMHSALQDLGIAPEQEKASQEKLSVEVNAILDRTAGLEKYTRDDPLKEKVLQHFQISLERMVALARSAGAQIIFVTPASNIKDFSPFKSEHSPHLSAAEKAHSEALLAGAQKAIRQEDWSTALPLLEEAARLDPRHSEIQYTYGRALLSQGRLIEAEEVLRIARDEDVCPLRALTEISETVTQVARKQDVPVVDYVKILEQRMRDMKGIGLPGDEYFLDHVHPTVEGFEILSVALVEAMIEEGITRASPAWNDDGIQAVARKIEQGIDRADEGQAFANIARVLLWAGKHDDAARLAKMAQQTAGDVRQVAVDSASILTSVYVHNGQPERAVELLYSAIERAPGAVELHLKLGQTILFPPFERFEEAAANILLACQQVPTWDGPQTLFGLAMSKIGRQDIAYYSLMEALRLNPKSAKARSTLSRVHSLLRNGIPGSRPSHIFLDVYPSKAPRKLIQLARGPSGRPVPDGIEVEFHENGRIKRYLDLEKGVLHGVEVTWGPDGTLLSRTEYRNGNRLVAHQPTRIDNPN